MLAPAVLCIAKSMNHQHITLLIIHIDLYLMTQVHPVHVCNHAWPKHMLVADEEIHSAEFSGLWNMLLKWRSCLSLSSDRTVIFNLLDFNWQKGISNTLLLINRHFGCFYFRAGTSELSDTKLTGQRKPTFINVNLNDVLKVFIQ